MNRPVYRRPPVLEADGLGKSFGSQVVLKAASFSAKPGVVTALMGRNGAGKTTMLRIAVGCLGADYGRVLFDGAFQQRPSLASMARQGLFYSAQDSALTDLFTVGDQLQAIAGVHGGHEHVAGAIETLRIGHLLGALPWSLSGGERQRCALAMAVVRRPTCLLMDEPFAGVQPKDRPLILGALHHMRSQGAAIVISGHDVDDIFAAASEIIWVVAGTTHVLGTPREASQHGQFCREYLGPRRLAFGTDGSLASPA